MTNVWIRKIDEQAAKIKELEGLSAAMEESYIKEFDKLKAENIELKKTLSEISNGISSLEGIKE